MEEKKDIQDLTAEDVMTSGIICIKQDASFEELMQVFYKHKISGVVVVGSDDEIKGVVSIYDVIESQDDEEKSFYRGNIESNVSEKTKAKIDIKNKQTVAKIMTPVVIHASQDTPIQEVARMMANAKIHRIIISNNGQYTGIVTSMDMVKVLCEL